jgi:hypothetical protein
MSSIDNYTWTLFHSIIQQIDEKYYSKYRHILLKHIYLISASHRCSICSQHAIEYFNNTIIHIYTKEDFISFLFHFHNHINTISKKELFSYADLSKYTTTSIPDVIDKLNTLFADDPTLNTINYIQLFRFYNTHTECFDIQ